MCPGVWSHLQGWELCGMALSLRGWGLNVWNQMWTELCFQKMGALFGKMQQMEQGGHSWNRSFRQCHTQCVVVSTVIFLIGHSTQLSAATRPSAFSFMACLMMELIDAFSHQKAARTRLHGGHVPQPQFTAHSWTERISTVCHLLLYPCVSKLTHVYICVWRSTGVVSAHLSRLKWTDLPLGNFKSF